MSSQWMLKSLGRKAGMVYQKISTKRITMIDPATAARNSARRLVARESNRTNGRKK